MFRIIHKSILFFCFILLTLISPSNSRYLYSRCDDTNGNYTANTTYQSNLDSVVLSLVSATASTTGFFSRSAGGQTPDEVNAIALCRGDVEPDSCRRCLNDSNDAAKRDCPYRKGATVWYDDCMLRYSSETILGNVDTNTGGYIWTRNNIPNAGELYQALRPLMDRLRSQAAGGDSRRKFASGDTSGPGIMRIYGLMQCTPDLSEFQCYGCLETATNTIHGCCSASLDVRILYASCNLRYSTSRFYDSAVVLSPPPMEAPPLSPPPPPSQPPPSESSNTTIIIIAAIASVSVVMFVAVFVCVFVRRKRKLEGHLGEISDHEPAGNIDEISSAKSLRYSFGIIKAATNNFSEKNKLGYGGFGVVYKGKLPNGKEIAVKRLSRDSEQGEEEFTNEVVLLAKLQHRNLVRLLGFSLERSERILMYEFMQNASLDKFIFDPMKRVTLDWVKRYKIIVGIARGILYLHEDSRLKIIHRDLKASNILLDDQMTPKIADFDMARLFTPEETQANTCRIVGTYGYMAPEYALHGQFSVKSDVFSFGVLVLEIVTGRNNHTFQDGVVIEDLLTRAWKCWQDGTASTLIDLTLRDGSNFVRDMIRCIQIGLLCVQEEVSVRPTMGSVVLMLSSSSLTIAITSKPAFYEHTSNNPKKPLLKYYTSSTSDDSNGSRTKSRPALGQSISSDISGRDLYPGSGATYPYGSLG